MIARFAAFILLCWLLAPGARAQNYLSQDLTGLWWNRAEPGWALNLVAQGDALVATLLAYDAQGKPAWHMAALHRAFAPGAATYTGALHETSGPWFGGPFDSRQIAFRAVGNMTVRVPFSATEPRRVTYSVDENPVDKVITRYVFAPFDIAGRYAALFSVDEEFGVCNPAGLPAPPDSAGSIEIIHGETDFGYDTTFTLRVGSDRCIVEANVRSPERPPGVLGTYYCPAAGGGPFRAAGNFEWIFMELRPGGFSGSAFVQANGSNCRDFIAFSATREAP